MNLYYAASLYHILCYSIHALLFQKDQKAHLVLSDNIFSKSGMDELTDRLKASGIFDQVLVMAFTRGEFFNEYALEEGCSRDFIQKHLDFSAKQIEQWLAEKKICLDDYSNKYTAIDHRLLGMYFLYKGYPYSYFEDGNGLLSRSKNQLELHKQLQYETYCIVTELHGFGENSLVKEKFANADAQLPGFYDPKMTDFNAVKLFGLLTPRQKQQVFTIYGITGQLNTGTGKTFLFLTRFAKYLKKPDVFHHMYLNGVLLDLFAKEHQVIIKPHPRDYSGTYELSYPDAIVLERTFPSELLPYLQEEKFDRIMTIGSTAIDALSDFGHRILKFDQEMERKSDYLFTYYMAVRITLDLFPDIRPEDLSLFGCSMELMNPLFETYGGFLPQSPRQLSSSIAIVDEQQPGFKPKADVIIYLHTNRSFQFFKEDPDCFPYLTYLDVTLLPDSDFSLSEQRESYLLVEARNPSVRKRLAGYSYNETLPHTKAILQTGMFSPLKRQYMLNRLWLKALHVTKEPLLQSTPLFLTPEKDFYDENTLFLLQKEIQEMQQKR